MAEPYFLVIVNRSPAEWRVEVRTDPQVIGRGNDADVRVQKSNASVSRRHAKIWVDDVVWIEDLSSTWGTHVNGIRLPTGRPTEISLNDRIRFGALECVLVDDAGMRSRLIEVSDQNPDSRSEDPLIRLARHGEQAGQPVSSELDKLSNAERNVVMWLMRGVTEEADIGKRMSRSAHTVRSHLNKIFKKLNVHTRHELMSLLMKLDVDDSTSS